MTNEKILSKLTGLKGIYLTHGAIRGSDALEAMDAARREEAIRFLDKIRDYERESGNQICYDERSSEQLYSLFKNKDNGK